MIRDLTRLKDYASLPTEMITWIILNRLKTVTNNYFGLVAKEYFPNISEKTYQNYMAEARILNFKNVEKYFVAGSTVITRLAKILESDNKFEELADPIADAFVKLSNGKAIFSENDYERVANYVAFLWKDLKDYSMDYELFSDLFNTGYDFKISDVRYIISRSKKQDGKIDYDFVKKYFHGLLAFELDTKKVKSFFDKQLIPLKQSAPNEDDIPTVDKAVSDLRLVIAHFSDGKHNLENDELNSIWEVYNELGAFLKKDNSIPQNK